MKTIKLFFIASCLALVYTGCKKDNYAAPDSGIYGALTDGEIGGPLQLKQPGGGTVRLIQWDKARFPNPSPIDISVKVDGTYTNTQLFASAYKIFPQANAGPYMYAPLDSVLVTLKPNEQSQVNFKVVPYYRIAATVTDSTFTYTVTKSAANIGNLSQVIFMISTYGIVNENVSSKAGPNNINGTNLFKLNVTNAILGVPQIYKFNWAETKLPKGTYYFRVGAVGSTSSSYFNYSPVIKAVVH